MSTVQLAPAFSALAKGVSALQSELVRLGHADDDIRLLIPAKLGERIERELIDLDPLAWTPLTPGIGIYADGHLKQFTLLESITVGWKLGRCSERTDDDGKPRR